eukprot:403358971
MDDRKLMERYMSLTHQSGHLLKEDFNQTSENDNPQHNVIFYQDNTTNPYQGHGNSFSGVDLSLTKGENYESKTTSKYNAKYSERLTQRSQKNSSIRNNMAYMNKSNFNNDMTNNSNNLGITNQLTNNSTMLHRQINPLKSTFNSQNDCDSTSAAQAIRSMTMRSYEDSHRLGNGNGGGTMHSHSRNRSVNKYQQMLRPETRLSFGMLENEDGQNTQQDMLQESLTKTQEYHT